MFNGVLWWCGGVVSALDGRRQVGGVRKGATGRAGASGRGGGPARLNWGLHLEVGGVPGGAGLVFRFFSGTTLMQAHVSLRLVWSLRIQHHAARIPEHGAIAPRNAGEIVLIKANVKKEYHAAVVQDV